MPAKKRDSVAFSSFNPKQALAKLTWGLTDSNANSFQTGGK